MEKKNHFLSIIVQGKFPLSYPIMTTGGVNVALLSSSSKTVDWKYDALF
jgi:hypothetical protein